MLQSLWSRLVRRAAPRGGPSIDPIESSVRPVRVPKPESTLPSQAREARPKVTLPRAIPPRFQATPTQPAQASPLPPRRVIPWRQVALVSVALVVGLAILLTITASQARQPQLTDVAVQTLVAEAMASATPPPSTASIVYQRIAHSVVLISTRGEGDEDEDPGVGLGSGVVLDDVGHILTSLHVVEGARQIRVTFADGTTVEAAIEGDLPEKDIAVLVLLEPVPMLVPATLGNPGALNVGDEAIVVGNPFGLRHTTTAGVISGLDRDFESSETGQVLEDLIQFDTAVNPGNSGGPLLNRDGEVVGIVTALANPTEEKVFIGIGFAVPIDVAAGAAGPPPF